MKSSLKIAILLSMFLNISLTAQEGHEEDPHFIWFEANEVTVKDDEVYAFTNKGPVRLNTME